MRIARWIPVRWAIATLTLCALMGLAGRLSAATRETLNGDWQFRVDAQGRGQAEGWWKNMPNGTRTVQVPHTWNIGEYEDYEGIAWYFKMFEIPEEYRGKHLEIHFGATFYRARLWLNGAELGSHEGGHTSYYFALPANLPAKNFLAVAIDNRPTEASIPGLALRLKNTGNLWYDWWHYGGIVRDVWLTSNESVLLRRQRIRTELQGQDAVVTDRVFLENVGDRARKAILNIRARLDVGTDPAIEKQMEIEIGPGTHQAELSLRILSAHFWHFDHPNLYQIDADLSDPGGKRLDSISSHFGLRTVEIHDASLYLNGEPVRLTGVTRHEDSPWEGLAETRGTWKHDYDEMKDLQVVLTRPVHYPQLPEILDYCDRHGILLVPEIPLWQFDRRQLGNPEVHALAKQMFREMVDEDFNHPSIFAWSVCNECEIHSPEGIEYVRQMRDWEKSLDPDRFITFADDLLPGVQEATKSASQYADFLEWNQYFGTWHGPASLLPGVIRHIHATFPDKMAIVSEFGAASIFAQSSANGDKLRAQVIHDQLTEFAKHSWIAGAVFWCYQDYRSHRNLWPGLTNGYVEMGLVEQNRQRRPSYYVWQEETSPVKLTAGWKNDNQYPFVPTGFRAEIERRRADELPSYALHGYHAAWELRNRDNEVVASGEKELGEIGPAMQIEEGFPRSSSRSWTLSISIYRPTGFVALRKEIVWQEPVSGGEGANDMKQKGTFPANPAILETKPTPPSQ